MAEKGKITKKQGIIAAVLITVIVGALLIGGVILYFVLGSEALKSFSFILMIIGVLFLLLGITVVAVGFAAKRFKKK